VKPAPTNRAKIIFSPLLTNSATPCNSNYNNCSIYLTSRKSTAQSCSVAVYTISDVRYRNMRSIEFKFSMALLNMVLGTRACYNFSAAMGASWQLEMLFYITDGWPVYPMFIPDGDQIICKTYMTRVEGENTRLRHYLARLHRQTLCYSKSGEMLKHSIRLVIHYLKFWDVPVPYPSYHFNRAQTRQTG